MSIFLPRAKQPFFQHMPAGIVETEGTCLEFSSNVFHSLTFVLTQMHPSPSQMVSHTYFGALR